MSSLAALPSLASRSDASKPAACASTGTASSTLRKGIAYAYPSSPFAVKHGCGRSGCFYVYTFDSAKLGTVDTVISVYPIYNPTIPSQSDSSFADAKRAANAIACEWSRWTMRDS